MGDESSPRSDQTGEEKGVVQYDTPRGQITLTIQIVRRFFCPKATELEALAFAGYCKHTGLNPFLREVYLVKYDESEPASIMSHPTARRNPSIERFPASRASRQATIQAPKSAAM